MLTILEINIVRGHCRERVIKNVIICTLCIAQHSEHDQSEPLKITLKMGWCLTLLKVLLYSSATLGYVEQEGL